MQFWQDGRQIFGQPFAFVRLDPRLDRLDRAAAHQHAYDREGIDPMGQSHHDRMHRHGEFSYTDGSEVLGEGRLERMFFVAREPVARQ